MKVLFADWSAWQTHKTLRQRMTQAVTTAYNDARKVLPEIPDDLTFIIQPHQYMANTDETAEFGSTANDHLVILLFDPGLPIAEGELLRNMRRRVFHELVPVVRWNKSLWGLAGFLDACLQEGLATVFVREHANTGIPAWGQYQPDEASAWLQEVQAVAKKPFRQFDYMRRHPDGRRWIGIKIGIYLVDRAIQASGVPVEQLVVMPMGKLRKLAGLPEA